MDNRHRSTHRTRTRLVASTLIVSLGWVAAPAAMAADTVVSTASGDSKTTWDYTSEAAGNISNYYGAYQAFVAVISFLYQLTNPNSSKPAGLTEAELAADLANLGTSINNWDINQYVGRIGGDLDTALSLAQNCVPNCNRTGELGDADYTTGSDMRAITELLVDKTALFTRTANNALVQGPWQNAIPSSAWAPVVGGNVFDWRGGVQFFMLWITKRLIFMQAVDHAGYPQDFSSEISAYVDTLTQVRDTMRGGIKCGLNYDPDNLSSDCNAGNMNPFRNPSVYPMGIPTEYCVDVYSGTYASRILGGSRCDYSLSSSEQDQIAQADRDLSHEVYNNLPIQQIEHLISSLSLQLYPRNHGFLIRTPPP